MVQKFVKELNDSAKQSNRSDSAERTATEQVETTAREIVHEAVRFPRRMLPRPDTKESADASTEARSNHTPEPPRQRTDSTRIRREPQAPQSAPTPAPPEQARRAYVQQTAKTATSASPIMSEQPQHTTVTAPLVENTPRQRTDDVRTRSEPKQPQSAPAPASQEQARRAYVQQTAKTATQAPQITAEQPTVQHPTTVPTGENAPRQRTEDIRTRPESKQPQSTPAPASQEQARRAYVQQAAKGSETAPSNTLEQSKAQRPTSVVSSAESAPRQRTEDIRTRLEPQRSQSKPIPASQEQARRAYVKRTKKSRAEKSSARDYLYTEQPPAIREKTKPNATQREESRRGVDIRTREAAQISTPTAQPKMPASKTATKRARKAATQDAQRKMLKKTNSRAARAAAAAAKKLAEAAAKAVKELISALAGLGGGTALFIVFSIVIVAGAFLASPLGILFADEQQADDTVPLATTIAEIQGEYHAELERLQNGDFASVQIVGQAPDWREVVAVFASKTAGAEDGVDVFTLDEERVELLRQVFWDMCEITTATQTVDIPDSDPDDDMDDSHTGIALTITITAKTAEQMRMEYSFTKYQNDALDILLENLGSLNIPMGSLTISQEDAIELLENLPDDLDPARKAVVETAVQLVGRVSYFWGGKSLTLGWDDRWGVPTEVTAAGSGSTGTIRPFGLDCSGFVDWTFYNATNGSYYPGRGGGAATQHSYCTNIAWSDAQPGDLVFYPDDSHVGIVGGKDADGNLLIVHCSGGANGVVITGSAGFTAVARPDCFTG